jgi:anti-sigma-K factor RskA
MPGENSRVARAGDYILGLMSDAERERAERDLEVDAAFRDTVMQMAERMRVFDRAAPDTDPPDDDRWKFIAGRIAELPQMQFSVAGGSTTRAADSSRTGRFSLLSTTGGHVLAIGASLILAFALGYLAGKS